MNLMGRYAAANHALIHKHIAKKLGAHVILDIENHHNFAWKETHVVNGEEREVIVHRKGATPAGAGVLGIIPGSMASPGFVVRGKGQPESLHSASHGAGRVMSRNEGDAVLHLERDEEAARRARRRAALARASTKCPASTRTSRKSWPRRPISSRSSAASIRSS